MDKIRGILKRKINFIHWNAGSDNYMSLEMEFIDLVFETPELGKLMKNIILKDKIDSAWLQDVFNSHLLLHAIRKTEPHNALPTFYDKEIETRTHLWNNFEKVIKEEQKEITKNDRRTFSLKEIKESTFSHYNKKNEYHLKKLYIDLVQEIDLYSTETYNKPTDQAITFDNDSGILTIGKKEIKLSKKGKETDAKQLMATLFKTPIGEWKYKDEILLDWGYNEEDQDIIPKNKIYFSAKTIKDEILKIAHIDDFIEFNTSKARINPKYRN
jgi:hypothetical protein